MNLLQKIKYSQNWNIGFCEQTPKELVQNKKLNTIQWMKHSYRDRWFADPFIYKMTPTEIIVFVEECPMEYPKGVICELVVDRKTKRLKSRYVLLELDTHLSYPAIIQYGGKMYVYPENGASGKLNLYEYDEKNHRLINPICILDKAVADATIVEKDGHYYISATKFPKTQEQAFLYMAETPFGPFRQVGELPYQTDRCFSRQGGNWFHAKDKIYRPAQDCVKRYGAALSIMEVHDINIVVNETRSFYLRPTYFRYNLGLHTLNFYDGLCVIDGYGYYYPVLGRIYYSNILRKLIGKNH